MDPADLIETAIALAGGRRPPGRGQPGQTDLRRALSTIYYAAFHALANNNADSFTWTTTPARRDPAWALGYRAIDRRTAGERRQPERVARFPREIKEMSDLFIRLRTGRNQAGCAPGGHTQGPTEGVDPATGGGGAVPVAACCRPGSLSGWPRERIAMVKPSAAPPY